MMSSKKILAMNLKYYRLTYNLSQERFAEKVGSNLVYINQLENCKRKPTIEMLDKIAEGMNKNIAFLIVYYLLKKLHVPIFP